MSTIFYEDTKIGTLDFIKCRDREAIFLKKELCENVPSQYHKRLYHFSPAYVYPGLCIQQPNADFLAWADEMGIKFFVQQMWPDGCEVTTVNPNDAVILKLRWPIETYVV